MSQIIFTKTATSGQQIEVQMEELADGRHQGRLTLDGKYMSSWGRAALIDQPKGDITHYIGRVGLTTAEAAQINGTLAQADAASPKARLVARREERRLLVCEYQGFEEAADAAFERGHESDGSAAWTAKRAYDGRIEAARVKLAEFDAAHPEVLEAIRAEKDEAHQRWQAAD
jgi:hypothetical protein